MHVRTVLQHLVRKLYLRKSRKVWDPLSLSFLGFIVAEGRLQMDPNKVSAVPSWPIPETRNQLQRFLSPISTSISFVTIVPWLPPNFLNVFQDPVCLVICRWAGFPGAEESCHFGPHSASTWFWQFVVKVDASDVGMGPVLSQCSATDHKLQPVPSSLVFCPLWNKIMTLGTGSSEPALSVTSISPLTKPSLVNFIHFLFLTAPGDIPP